jgi:hypothetical protein
MLITRCHLFLAVSPYFPENAPRIPQYIPHPVL